MPNRAVRNISLDPALAALSRDAVSRALAGGDETVLEAVSRCIRHYAQRAGEELRAGRDYLPLLTPRPETPPLEAVAMGIVLETMEEELAGEDDTAEEEES
jgi:phytoene/squalene synthetase